MVSDKIMKNDVIIRALPAIELIIALPSSYPSNQRPLILQKNPFYRDNSNFEEFMVEKINEKWSEEMPVLYEIAIFL